MSDSSRRGFDSCVQLIAVCPLLAMSDTVVDALGLSAAVLIVVPLAAMLLAFVRSRLDDATALAAAMLTLAALVACVELLMSAWLNELRASLGLFLPLMVANLILVESLQAAQRPPPYPPPATGGGEDVSTPFPRRSTPLPRRLEEEEMSSVRSPARQRRDGVGAGAALASGRGAVLGSLRIAIGIAVTLLPLSIARELVGRGSLLHDAGTLLGAWAARLETNVFPVDMGFLLALLPPGAFIAFGLLLAARNWLAAQVRS
jgi:Na+-translocating ferredoxin:NAD+ oxidoreductase subunit E